MPHWLEGKDAPKEKGRTDGRCQGKISLFIWHLAELILFDKKDWVLITHKTYGSVGAEDVQTKC